MKKQIFAYRKEIINLSTTKKASLRDKGKIGKKKNIPKLDLSKVK